jgi:hypothetical protein
MARPSGMRRLHKYVLVACLSGIRWTRRCTVTVRLCPHSSKGGVGSSGKHEDTARQLGWCTRTRDAQPTTGWLEGGAVSQDTVESQ